MTNTETYMVHFQNEKTGKVHTTTVVTTKGYTTYEDIPKIVMTKHGSDIVILWINPGSKIRAFTVMAINDGGHIQCFGTFATHERAAQACDRIQKKLAGQPWLVRVQAIREETSGVRVARWLRYILDWTRYGTSK